MKTKQINNVTILIPPIKISKISDLYEFLNRDPGTSNSKEIEQCSRAAIEQIPSRYISERLNDLRIDIGPLIDNVRRHAKNKNSMPAISTLGAAEQLDALLDIDEISNLSIDALDEKLGDLKNRVDIVTSSVTTHIRKQEYSSDTSAVSFEADGHLGGGNIINFTTNPQVYLDNPESKNNAGPFTKSKKLIAGISTIFLGIAASLLLLAPCFNDQKHLTTSDSLQEIIGMSNSPNDEPYFDNQFKINDNTMIIKISNDKEKILTNLVNWRPKQSTLFAEISHVNKSSYTYSYDGDSRPSVVNCDKPFQRSMAAARISRANHPKEPIQRSMAAARISRANHPKEPKPTPHRMLPGVERPGSLNSEFRESTRIAPSKAATNNQAGLLKAHPLKEGTP